ncbi:MAG: hypothetical protein RL199_1708 [Pseudomonadota bacterium]|jgi:hypothetical protein
MKVVRSVLAGVVAVWAVGCADSAPQLLTLQDRTVRVNETVEFDVAATDADSQQLTFSMEPAVRGAKLASVGGQFAKFSWTPNPAQRGLTTFTFKVSDGERTDTETMSIRVSSDDPPKLESPDRYLVDLATSDDVAFTLEWKDPDSPRLTFSLDPDPTKWGAKLGTDAKKVSFEWAPDEAQRKVARHAFTVRAADEDGHVATSTIAILLKGERPATGCDPNLQYPVIGAAAFEPLGDGGYVVAVGANDAESALQSVDLFWSLDAGASGWQHQGMERHDADSWGAIVTDFGIEAGTDALVTYRFCAMDDDDPTGDTCDGVICTDDQVQFVIGPPNETEPFVCRATNVDNDDLNDVAAGAACLEEPWPLTITGTLSGGASDGSVRDEVDFYVVDVPKDSWLTAYILQPPFDALGDARLQIYSHAGDVLDASETSLHPSVAWQADRAGIVSIEVTSGALSAASGTYELHVDVFGPEGGVP